MFDTTNTLLTADGLLAFAEANSGELSQFNIMGYIMQVAHIALNHSDVELLPGTRKVAELLIDAVDNAMANWEEDKEAQRTKKEND